MSQFSSDAEDFARLLIHAGECIMYFHNVSSYDDCNNCGKKDCKYKPEPGQMVRINCPLWER